MDFVVGGMHLGGLDLDYNFDYSEGMRRDHAADKEIAVLVIHMQACYSSVWMTTEIVSRRQVGSLDYMIALVTVIDSIRGWVTA